MDPDSEKQVQELDRPKVAKPKKKAAKRPAPKRKVVKTKPKKKTAKRKAAKRPAKPKAKKNVGEVARSERLDMRLTKAEKTRVVAKAKKTRRTVTSLIIEAIEKIK